VTGYGSTSHQDGNVAGGSYLRDDDIVPLIRIYRAATAARNDPATVDRHVAAFLAAGGPDRLFGVTGWVAVNLAMLTSCPVPAVDDPGVELAWRLVALFGGEDYETAADVYFAAPQPERLAASREVLIWFGRVLHGEPLS
jgi:hypothetical protein